MVKMAKCTADRGAKKVKMVKPAGPMRSVARTCVRSGVDWIFRRFISRPPKMLISLRVESLIYSPIRRLIDFRAAQKPLADLKWRNGRAGNASRGAKTVNICRAARLQRPVGDARAIDLPAFRFPQSRFDSLSIQSFMSMYPFRMATRLEVISISD